MRGNIVITGASSGLGAEMARQFAARGRNLALCARRIERLTELREEITSRHPSIRIAIRQRDVTDYDDVFTAFDAFAGECGSLDRVIVNAGIGQGRRIGDGGFTANLTVARNQRRGSARPVRSGHAGIPGAGPGTSRRRLVDRRSARPARGSDTSAATKAGVAALVLDRPIRVTTLYPGFNSSEMNPDPAVRSMIVDTMTGVRAMVKAIEQEVNTAYVPPWLWGPLAFAMRLLPLRIVAKFSRSGTNSRTDDSRS
jgi:short-subunit dehydrogenase